MHTRTDTTGTGTGEAAITWPYTSQQFDDLDEAIASIDGGEESALGHLNSLQDQNAKQSPKGAVKDYHRELLEKGYTGAEMQAAIDADESDDEALQKLVDLVHDAQRATSEAILGRPRGVTGGMTKTAASNFGKKALEQLGAEKLAALAEEYGIDL